MKRLRVFLIAATLMTAGSALATAQPRDHDGRGDRDRERYEHRDRDDRRFRDRDDFRFRDRDDVRFRDRDDVRFRANYYVGERQFFDGYYWTWDGAHWCRRSGGVTLYFGF